MICQQDEFAFYSHDGQQRRDGSNYITHPVEVASILLELRMDPDTICAALMHDVLEDCDVNKGNLRELFGEKANIYHQDFLSYDSKKNLGS